MKIFTNKNLTKKIIIAFVCVFLLNFCVTPTRVEAGDGKIGGDLLQPIKDLVTFLGDMTISLVQYGITGRWISAKDSSGSVTIDSNAEYWTTDTFEYPIIQISPELIFANQVEILNIDFIGGSGTNSYVLESSGSITSTLRTIIASWYVALRTLAMVGLLSVLIYIGIKIIISSSSQDKAKYKQRIVDWIVAFCLLFFMHYIMAGTISVVNRIDQLLSGMVGITDENGNIDLKGVDLNKDYGDVSYTPTKAVGGNSNSLYDIIFGDTETKDTAIQKTKNLINEKGYTIKSESSGWKEVDYREWTTWLWHNNYERKSEYTIECQEGDIIIVSEESSLYIPPISNNGFGRRSEEENFSIRTENFESGAIDVGYNEFNGIRYSQDPSKILYFINYARLYLNASSDNEYIPMSVGFLLIYIILIVFTVMFAFRYMKRVIYIAFLTLMAPLVALTYPIDKIKDRKSTSI